MTTQSADNLRNRVTGIIYVIQGDAGDYDERSTWTVDAWTTRALAERRCEELNKIAADYSKEDRAHGHRCPDISDDSPEADAAFDRWLRKAKSMLRTARRKAGDPALVLDARYSVLPVMVMQ